jgi:hypothetical protein
MNTMKITEDMYAFDFILTVIFPTGADSYEDVHRVICTQAQDMLSNNLKVRGPMQSTGGEEVDTSLPIKFFIQEVTEEERNKLLAKGRVLLRSSPEQGKSFPDGRVIPIAAKSGNAIYIQEGKFKRT